MLDLLTRFDLIALGLMIFLWYGTGWLIENPPARRLSVSILMQDYRREWMKEFVTRQPRIFDASVIDSLRQGTAFFASASMIAIGGGVALIGNAATIQGLAAELPLQAERSQLAIKALVAVAFLANALLKFVWSNRLFGYCSVMMAAVPNNPDHPEAYSRAAQAAEINITAAKSFNRGLHSIYFALAALSWFFGAPVLAGVSVLTAAMLLRREFASTSRQVMQTPLA